MMNVLVKVLLVFLLPSISFHVHSDEKASTLLLEKLLALGEFSSTYQQTIVNDNGQLLESAKGSFHLAKHQAFRNDVHSPEQTRTVSDGKTLWMIDDELEQVTIASLEGYLEGSPLALLLERDEQALASYKVEPRQEGESIHFLLRNKSPYEEISDITVIFKASQLKQISLKERSGKTIRIEFESMSPLNDQSLFKADFPASYAVVDER